MRLESWMGPPMGGLSCHQLAGGIDYFRYYHRWRTHQSLEMDAPDPRPVQSSEDGRVIEIPEVGGLHHHYERIAA